MKQAIPILHDTVPATQASVHPLGPLAHPLQRQIDSSPRQSAQAKTLTQLRNAAASNTRNGLPHSLLQGIESLSGMDMSDVVVHHNSSKPAQLNALAFAQGNEIHLAPGQEKHLPHEAWHVIQQRQGRVPATGQLAGVAINDNPHLEREADIMGQRAMQLQRDVVHCEPAHPRLISSEAGARPIQLKWIDRGTGFLEWDTSNDGVRWYYDLKTQRMFYVIEKGENKYAANAGYGNAKTREDWVKLYGSDPLGGEDPSVVPGEEPTAGVVELGAGEGRFSQAFRQKFAADRTYIATDIAKDEGNTGFLSLARKAGIKHMFNLNANEVDRYFSPGSVKRFVAANPYGGGRDAPDASFGLMKYADVGNMHPDHRFLNSAWNVLPTGGKVDFYGRTNTLHSGKKEKLPKRPTKTEMRDNRKRSAKVREIEDKMRALKDKYPITNENPYLNISPKHLSDLAKQTGYRVRLKRAKQPPNTLAGGDPDTRELEGNTRKEGLKPFTTRFTFTKAGEDYVSDDEHPRVEYDSDEASDWETE